MLYLIPRI